MTDDTTGPIQRPSKHRRPLALALAAASIFALAFAAFSKQWLVREDEVRIGLTGTSVCFGDDCKSMSNGELVAMAKREGAESGSTSGAFGPMGWATLVEILVAVAGLAGALALAIARKQPVLPIAPSTVGFIFIAFALITGCVFVATKPGPTGFVAVGPAFWVFGAGVITGVAAAQLLARVNRPEDPDLMADAMNPDEY
jgi:hypothetical protein